MAGGRNEYVMSVQYDSEDKENLSYSHSGFDQNFLNNLPSRYIDKYKYGTSQNDTNRLISEDATIKTLGWHNDYYFFAYSVSPWFARG